MTLWFDVEDLFIYRQLGFRPSGIQRLSFELYVALMEIAPDLIGFVRHDPLQHTMRVVDWPDVRAIYAEISVSEGAPSRLAGTMTFPAARTVIRWLPAEVRPLLGSAIRAQITAVRALIDFARASVKLAVRSTKTRLSQVNGRSNIGTNLTQIAKPGDVFCTFGAPWGYGSYAKLVAGVTQATGMRFCILVYDLIPIIKREFCLPNFTQGFMDSIGECLPLADHILTISKATADDVVAWADRESISLKATPSPVPIGTGFTPQPGGELPKGLQSRRFVLFVSTIEARKNHLLAFRIWLRMLEERNPDEIPVLVFAGRVGWMVADLMQAIDNTGYLDGKLMIVRDPDDATLSELYRHCMFTLFPSHYEGWGLPVSESLAFGRTCVASNRASVPEAGRDFCVYIDPDDTTAAYEAVTRLIDQPVEVEALEARIAADYRPTAWRETAECVMAIVSNHPNRRAGEPI